MSASAETIAVRIIGLDGTELGFPSWMFITRMFGWLLLGHAVSQPLEYRTSDTIAKTKTAPMKRRLGLVLGLTLLLLAEVLGLSYRFDGQGLVDGGRWWGHLIAYLRFLPQTLMAVAAAALVFGGPRLWSELLSSEPEPRSTRGRTFLLLVGHLGSFAALIGLTAAVWEGSLGQSAAGPFWILAWFLMAVATLGFWLAAVVPVSAWRELARGGVSALCAAFGFGVVAILAGRLTAGLWEPLSGATFWMVKTILSLGFSGVVADPASQVLGTTDFQVEIATECAGFEGIGLIWVFLAAYLWAFRRSLRFPRALWLLPVGTVVMWLANALRIALLVTIGSLGSPSVALGGFHSQAGWLAFNAVALGLVGVSRGARAFQRSETSTVETFSTTNSPTSAYLAPLLALVAIVMVSQASGHGTGFDLLYPARVGAVAIALFAFRRSVSESCLSWSWPAAGLGIAVFALWMALEPTPDSQASADVAAKLAGMTQPLALLWLIFRVLGSVVTVPIAEELAFRGYLTRRLIAADFSLIAPGTLNATSLLVSSLLFGVLHGRWVAGAIAGAVYALAYHRRGKLADAVLAHATTNALIAAYVLSTGTWSLWV